MATLTDIQAEIEALRAENAKLKAKAASRAPSLSMKVSAKGALSVYGLGRWPVTLYKGQWPKLLALKDDIEDFLIEHDSELRGKDDE